MERVTKQTKKKNFISLVRFEIASWIGVPLTISVDGDQHQPRRI